ncbi:hypothetical protein VNO77_14894 [Canavalia gladiata]|uniref:Uncharacterized protein n=1 Tax=Canavalia gladiata TaxID=3824 RepID=A0AAN9QS52_CANGL
MHACKEGAGPSFGFGRMLLREKKNKVKRRKRFLKAKRKRRACRERGSPFGGWLGSVFLTLQGGGAWNQKRTLQFSSQQEHKEYSKKRRGSRKRPRISIHSHLKPERSILRVESCIQLCRMYKIPAIQSNRHRTCYKNDAVLLGLREEDPILRLLLLHQESNSQSCHSRRSRFVW